MSETSTITHDDLPRQRYIAEHAPTLLGQILNGIAASGNQIIPRECVDGAIRCAGELFDQLVVSVK